MPASLNPKPATELSAPPAADLYWCPASSQNHLFPFVLYMHLCRQAEGTSPHPLPELALLKVAALAGQRARRRRPWLCISPCGMQQNIAFNLYGYQPVKAFSTDGPQKAQPLCNTIFAQCDLDPTQSISSGVG